MKVVLLAGGRGTRLAEKTETTPKPMVEIGGRPILWHIMKQFSHFSMNEFLIALGYQGDVIKHYFYDYYVLNNNLTINLQTGETDVHGKVKEDWIIHLFDTGVETLTGGRVWRLKERLREETFMVTYGDGVSDIDLSELLKFHRKQGRLATVTAVRPPARFGGLVFDGDKVADFTEKPQIGEGWINGGYMVFEPGVFDYLDETSSLEAHALEALARDGQLSAYQHSGFWQCMDTLRDVHLLEELWQGGSPPWKVWEK